jgi:hypothetical protein
VYPEEPGEWESGSASYAEVPEWAFKPSREPDEIETLLRRIHADRRSRAVVRFGEPRFLDAEELVFPPASASMRPDEYLMAVHWRGHYMACRPVDTVDRALAKKAGL